MNEPGLEKSQPWDSIEQRNNYCFQKKKHGEIVDQMNNWACKFIKETF